MVSDLGAWGGAEWGLCEEWEEWDAEWYRCVLRLVGVGVG